jgi:hypothetical protein
MRRVRQRRADDSPGDPSAVESDEWQLVVSAIGRRDGGPPKGTTLIDPTSHTSPISAIPGSK